MNTCPKRMINGPCGGYRSERCEDERLVCVWIVAYYSAIKRGTLEKMFSLKLDPGFKVRDYVPPPMRPRKALKKILEGGPFMIYEYTPKHSRSPLNVDEELSGIVRIYDGVDIVDSPGGYPIPSPLPYAAVLKKTYRDRDLHVSIQITGRNRDRNQVVSDLVAAIASGVDGIVATTGDLQDSGGVWDLDAPRIIYLARLVSDLGIDHAGRRVGSGGAGMVVAASINPHASPLEPEILKTRVKARAGAEMLITQPVFSPGDVARLEAGMKSLGARGIPIVWGLMPVMSRKVASFFETKVGIKIPEKVSRALAKGSREDLLTANIENVENIVRESGQSTFYISAFGDHYIGEVLGKTVRKALIN